MGSHKGCHPVLTYKSSHAHVGVGRIAGYEVEILGAFVYEGVNERESIAATHETGYHKSRSVVDIFYRLISRHNFFHTVLRRKVSDIMIQFSARYLINAGQ